MKQTTFNYFLDDYTEQIPMRHVCPSEDCIVLQYGRVAVVLWLASLGIFTTMAKNHTKEVPAPPYNITLVELVSTHATISWRLRQSDAVTKVEMVHRPITGPVKFKVVTELDACVKKVTLSNLAPQTEYLIYLFAWNLYGMSNISDALTFKTLTDDTMDPVTDLSFGEITLIVLALVAWMFAMLLFLYKWRSIRILQPREPRFKHSPKNLEEVKVVTKPSDGVIYKGYSSQLSKTMLAREKRIARMSTMPELRAISPSPSSPRVKEATSKLPPPLNKVPTDSILQLEKVPPEGDV